MKVLESPKSTMDTQSPATPMSSTGFRPMRSDARLHWRTNMASVAKNSDSWAYRVS